MFGTPPGVRAWRRFSKHQPTIFYLTFVLKSKYIISGSRVFCTHTKGGRGSQSKCCLFWPLSSAAQPTTHPHPACSLPCPSLYLLTPSLLLPIPIRAAADPQNEPYFKSLILRITESYGIFFHVFQCLWMEKSDVVVMKACAVTKDSALLCRHSFK